MRNSEGYYATLETFVARKDLDVDYGGTLPKPVFTIEGVTAEAAKDASEEKSEPGTPVDSQLAADTSDPVLLSAV